MAHDSSTKSRGRSQDRDIEEIRKVPTRCLTHLKRLAKTFFTKTES